MTTERSKNIWPATALICAAIIGVGAYFGLKASSASGGRSDGVSASDRIAGDAGAGQAVSNETATIVYITRTGECYHRGTCTCLRQSKIPMELSEAKKHYRPCSRCNPPG